MFRALLDTCVLFKPLLCDSLLSIAEEGLYQPLWSADILVELRRNLARHGVTEASIEHRITQMTTHFSDSMVTDYRRLISAMSNHPRDRHVLAAAVRGGAEVLVTEICATFPQLRPNLSTSRSRTRTRLCSTSSILRRISCSEH
jgi:predicted nucleic acid-binding protein